MEGKSEEQTLFLLLSIFFNADGGEGDAFSFSFVFFFSF